MTGANTQLRPWGQYTVLVETKNYKIKEIIVTPKGKLSLQKHLKRAEHWFVLQGTAKVIVDEVTSYLKPHESIFIPQNCVHRLENETDTNIVILEIQTGEYFGEDDIIRFKDIYGRKTVEG